MYQADNTFAKPYHLGDLKKALLDETARVLRDKDVHTESLSGAARLTRRDFIEWLARREAKDPIRHDVCAVQSTQLYWGTLRGISRLLLDGVHTKSASVKGSLPEQQICSGSSWIRNVNAFLSTASHQEITEHV